MIIIVSTCYAFPLGRLTLMLTEKLRGQFVPGRTLHLPGVRLLRLQWDDLAALCHTAVCQCGVGVW